MAKPFQWNRRLFVLILISVLNWVLLAPFRLRVYYTLIPLLFSMQVFLNDLLGHLLSSRAFGGRLFSLLLLPGTVVHELSHAVVALAMGCRLTSISLFNFQRHGVLGSVTYVHKRDRLSFIRELLVSLSPFFGSSVAVIAVSRLLLGGVIPFDSLTVNTTGLTDLVAGLMGYLAGQYSTVWGPAVFFALYLQVCFAFGAAPSSFDFQGVFKSLRESLSGFLLFILLLVSALFLVESPPALWGYGSILAGAVTSFLDWAVFLLCFSTAMLLFSIVSLYSLSLWLESKLALKLVSITVAAVVYRLAQFLGSNLSSVVAWISCVVFLLLSKHSGLFLKPKRSG